MTKRNMRAITYAEAMALIEAGRWATAKHHATGWFVWADSRGDKWSHNPYHGDGPSSWDFAYRATEEDVKGSWYEVTA